MTPSSLGLIPYKICLHYAIQSVTGVDFSCKNEVQIMTNKTRKRHCFPHLLSSGNGATKRMSAVDGGGKECKKGWGLS